MTCCLHGRQFHGQGFDDVKSDLLKSALWNLSIKDKQIASSQYKLPYQELAIASKSNDFDTWRSAWNALGTFFSQNQVAINSLSLHL